MRYLEVNQLTFAYEGENVLEKTSFHIDSGEFVGLTGENGAAKTTLLKASLGILKPKTGEVFRANQSVSGGALRISYVPQQIASFNAGFPSTVLEFVKSGRFARSSWFKRINSHDLEHVERALKAVGLWGIRDKRIGDLSGGQKQRLVIARSFASDPDLFVLDEPTTGMDSKSAREFYEIMAHSVHEHGKSVLMITHDSEGLMQYLDRNIHLARDKDGKFSCFEVHLAKREEREHV